VDRALSERVSDLLGSPIASRRRVSRGYTPAERWVVQLLDGRTAFVKGAVNDATAEWLRSEYRAYSEISAVYMPRMLGFVDGPRPILVLEDLSADTWPPAWNAASVEAVLDTLALVAATLPPSWATPVELGAFDLQGWRAVAGDPAPFLSLGLCTGAWLDAALPDLISASDACQLAGSQLLHFDVRSDNICIRNGKALLVDWNHASVGNAQLDTAFWLPSLASEGGPTPETILQSAPGEAAIVSGFFAARAGQPPVPLAPQVRAVQLSQLQHALPWVCRELSLESPVRAGLIRNESSATSQ
jgi:hypothetical protein